MLAFTFVAARGQQVATLPLGALPMQYNGGFAGEAGSPRFSTHAGLTSAGWSYGRGYHLSASYDQFIPALRSGIGVSVHQHRSDQSFAAYNAYSFSAAVAPKISLRGKWTFSPSLDVSYHAGRSVVYDDQAGFSGESAQWRSRVGFLMNTDKFYVGYSVAVADHLSVRFANGLAAAGRPFRFTSYLQIGYTFGRNPASGFSFTPQLTLATGTSPYPVLTTDRRVPINYFEAFHLNFRYRQFLWGVNNTGVHLGWQTDRLRVVASNGMSVAGRYDSGYVGNLSARYVLRPDKR